MAKANTTVENTAAENKNDELESLRAEFAKFKEETMAVIREQNEIIRQQSAVIGNNQDIFDKLKESKYADTAEGREVIETNERMKEKVEVYYPFDPLDEQLTHVPVLNPITGKVDRVKVGEFVTVTRAVAEILENSVKANKAAVLLQREKAKEFESTENAESNIDG